MTRRRTTGIDGDSSPGHHEMTTLRADHQSMPLVTEEPPVVLVVEDDRGLRESLAMVLEFQRVNVAQAESGEQGLELVDELDPAAVVLDINLPGIDGLEVCRRLRGRGDRRPVLMLTARHEIQDRVDGLDAGADDYLPKPFALEELLARVRSLLRRTGERPADRSADPGAELVLDDLVLVPSSRRVSRGDVSVELTKLEFDLLEVLLVNADVVVTRDILYERVWGYGVDLASNTLEVFVSSLRRKTEAGGRHRLIHTVRGVGYVARLP